jgi:hypothetical protein
MQIEGAVTVNPLSDDSTASRSTNVPEDRSAKAPMGNLVWTTISRLATRYRLQLNILKTLIEVIPSISSIGQLARNLEGVCVSGRTQKCYASESSCSCELRNPLCDNTVANCDSACSTGQKYCDVSYANPCSYDATVRGVTQFQIFVSCVSCAVELLMLVVTSVQFKHAHRRWVYILLNCTVIFFQLFYCLVLIGFGAAFNFSVDTTALVVFSKVVAIALGAAHLAHLIPLNQRTCRPMVECLQYGFPDDLSSEYD